MDRYENANMAARYEREIPEGYEARIEGNKVIIELKQSEDERIRKFLVKHVSEWIGCIEHDLKLSSKDVESEEELAMFKAGLAYLERQKEHFRDDTKMVEQKPASGEVERVRKAALKGIEYLERELGLDAIGDTDILDVKEYLERQKDKVVEFDHDREQRPAECIPDSVKFEEGFKTGRELGFREGVESVKPAEWNDADDKIQRNLMSLLSCMRGDRITEETYQKYYPWLRDLPKRFNLQQPAEDWREKRKKECPFRRNLDNNLYGCEQYAGVVYACDGKCSFVVDYPKLKEIQDKRERKPADWSEKDETMLKSILDEYKSMVTEKRIWLKILPERFNTEPKQEWSEEDEKMLLGIIERGSAQIPPHEPALREEQMEWLMNRLKFLRPRPHTVSVENATKFGELEYERGVKDGIQSEKSRHWKPSEEQMDYLQQAIEEAEAEHLYALQRGLVDLMEELKKLL